MSLLPGTARPPSGPSGAGSNTATRTTPGTTIVGSPVQGTRRRRGTPSSGRPFSGGGAAAPAATTAFPTTPLPLTAQDTAEFVQRRDAADRRYATAEVRTSDGLAKSEERFGMFQQRLRRDAGRELGGMRNTTGRAGLNFATSPLFAGTGQARIREQTDRTLNDELLASGDRDELLRNALLDAETSRRDEIDAIARDRARRASGQGRFEALIAPVGG